MFPHNRQPRHPLPKEYPRCGTVPAPCWLSPELVTGTLFKTRTHHRTHAHTKSSPCFDLCLVWFRLPAGARPPSGVGCCGQVLQLAHRHWASSTYVTTPSPSPPTTSALHLPYLLGCFQVSCSQPWMKMKIGASTRPPLVPSLPQLFFPLLLLLLDTSGYDVVGCRSQGGRLL